MSARDDFPITARYATLTLPPCPRCGGGEDRHEYVCPTDCDHGKVTVAQLVARWNAVESLTADDLMSVGWLDHLRSVRPSPSPKEGT